MLDLPNQDVALIGDVHQNISWLRRVITSLKRDYPHIRTYIQLGDFGLGVGYSGSSYLKKTNKWMKDREMLVLLGNHDDYDKYEKAVPSNLDGIRVLKEAPNLKFFERQAWFTLNGRKFLTVVGANSINKSILFDKPTTLAGIKYSKEWWSEEQITDEDVDNAISGGKVDIMLTHDVPTIGSPLNEEERDRGLEYFGEEGVNYALGSGEQLQRICDAVSPEQVIHGHFHKRSTIHAGGVRFDCLGSDESREGNVVIMTESGELKPYKVR